MQFTLYFLWTFKFASTLAITLNPNLQWPPEDLLGIESEREDLEAFQNRGISTGFAGVRSFSATL